MQTRKQGEWWDITVSKDWNGLTIETLLKDIWQVPKKWVHQLRMEKGIHQNNEPAFWNKPISEGAHLKIHFFPQEELDVEPQWAELEVLYEDDHLLIVNKPAGMETHPNEKGQTGTLANLVASHFQQNGISAKVRHVHRLDKDTTGAVVFAKNAIAGAVLDQMLEQRKIKRTYVAKVQGILRQKSGTISASIGRDRHHPTRRRVSPNGQTAATHYKLLAYDSREQTSIVQLQLDTGRTHQIRVHMSHLGHPLLGDVLYGGKPGFKRQALHAAHIHLKHPFTGEAITCRAPFLDTPPIFPAGLELKL